MATKAAKKSGKQKRKESRRLVLPREDAKAVEKYSRRERRTADGGRRQEGLCCADSYSRDAIYMATKAAKKSGKQKRKESRRACVAQRGRQGCWQVQQERTADGRRRMATRRLVLRRGLLKDAIYMATKAVDKYSRREWRTANGRRERRQEGSCCAESCPMTPRELATVKKKDS